MNTSDLEKNKAVIVQFDKVCVEQNNKALLDEFVSDQVVNHAAHQGGSNGKESFYHFLGALHKGLSDIKVEELLQIAENDLVVTRKIITGSHTGVFFGIAATGKAISIEAIEIIRLENDKYAEHWVQSNMSVALAALQSI